MRQRSLGDAGDCCPRSVSKFPLSAGETYTYHSVAGSYYSFGCHSCLWRQTSHYYITLLPSVGGRRRARASGARPAMSKPLPGHGWEGTRSLPHRCGSLSTPSLISDTLTLSSCVSVYHRARVLREQRHSMLSGGPASVGGV